MATDKKSEEPTQMETTTIAPISEEDKLWAEIQIQVAQIEKGVLTKETRFLTRILRTFGALRKRLTPLVLARAISTYFPVDHPRTALLSRLPAVPVSNTPPTEAATATAPATAPAIPTSISAEVDAYLSLLFVAHLTDTTQYELAIELGNVLVNQYLTANLRTLDTLLSKIYFLIARSYEKLNRAVELRPQLLDVLRTATLRRDEECQATLLNELLRNLLNHNLYDQAEKLVSKTVLPESVSNNQHARYLYYLGRIKAIQLDYSDSHKHLLQAIRKAPQTPAAPGFQQAVYKLAIIVQLLLGEIPERSLFRLPVLRRPLQPYLRLTQAVRIGDLRLFQEVVDKHSAQFIADKTYTLILRLRHNVIKTGVKMISVSYSRISLAELARKLHLDTVEDAEYIAAKAIRDGVIEAVLDHYNQWMTSREVSDVYSTTEPLNAFHQRISYCLNLHNEAIKALRFPSNAHKKDFESVEDRREREQQEKEFAKEVTDGGEDDDML